MLFFHREEPRPTHTHTHTYTWILHEGNALVWFPLVSEQIKHQRSGLGSAPPLILYKHPTSVWGQGGPAVSHRRWKTFTVTSFGRPAGAYGHTRVRFSLTSTHTHTHTVHSVCRASGFQEDTWMILASGLLFSSHNLRGSVAARIIWCFSDSLRYIVQLLSRAEGQPVRGGLPPASHISSVSLTPFACGVKNRSLSGYILRIITNPILPLCLQLAFFNWEGIFVLSESFDSL